MNFEWDPAKERANIQKHAISFDLARTVFDDPAVLTVDVTKPEYGEERTKAVGRLASGWIVAVIFIDRDLVRRLISARRARRHERRAYDSGYGLT